MNRKFDQRERKLVPRFRRRNVSELNVDQDDEETEQLIKEQFKK